MSVALGIAVEKKPLWGGGVGEEGIGVLRLRGLQGLPSPLPWGVGGGGVEVEVLTVPVRDQIRCDTVSLTPVDPPSSPPHRRPSRAFVSLRRSDLRNAGRSRCPSPAAVVWTSHQRKFRRHRIWERIRRSCASSLARSLSCLYACLFSNKTLVSFPNVPV